MNNINFEVIVPIIALIAFVAGIIRWLIGAWFTAVKHDRLSPSSTSIIVDASVDVVDVLRHQLVNMSREIDTLQQELVKIRDLLAEVERQREEWKHRAVGLGWVVN